MQTKSPAERSHETLHVAMQRICLWQNVDIQHTDGAVACNDLVFFFCETGWNIKPKLHSKDFI